MEDTKLLTVKELAKLLSVKDATIYKYTNLGMPCFSKKPLRFIESECLIWIRMR